MKTYRSTVSKISTTPLTLGEFLHRMTGLPLPQLSDAAAKGAVWLQRKGKGKILRERLIDSLLDPLDIVSFYHDPRILSLPEVTGAECLYEDQHFSVWHKPAGVVAQGTQSADHTSLLRYVEKVRNRETFLIHRLDRETAGLMIIGHTSAAANKLSALLVAHQIHKTYHAVVAGAMAGGHQGTINLSLDDKAAVTHYECLESTNNRSLLKVTIETGRLHQIRRHLSAIGHPVMGDPKYGSGNKNRQGLQLIASGLSFLDPWSKHPREFILPHNLTV
jgi:tRNA pseudouridine32 synthase / 23S rRNA pseudouridine746 synthase